MTNIPSENINSKKLQAFKSLIRSTRTWNKAKLLAYFEGKNISSYLCGLIKEAFKNNKRKIEISWKRV